MSRTMEITTVNDIGRLAGCSITTVSRVLNNTGPVSERSRQAVLKAVRDTDFYISRARKGGRRTPKRANHNVVDIIQHRHSPIEPVSAQGGELRVGPLTPPWGGDSDSGSFGADNSFHRGIVDGAIEELGRWGYRAHIRSNTDLLEPALLAELNAAPSGGLLLVGEPSKDLGQFVRNCRHPLVLVDVMGSNEADVVTTDNLEGMSEAFRHLYDLGHRKIGFVGARERFTGRVDERYVAYKLNMVERGLALREDWIYHGHDHITEVAEGVGEMLERSDRPSALLCQNDCCALGVMRAASRRGISVPSQLSVVGFDDVDSASLVTPPLSTVRVPVREMGRQAVRQLIVYLKGGRVVRGRGCRIRLIPELVLRESTAPCNG